MCITAKLHREQHEALRARGAWCSALKGNYGRTISGGATKCTRLSGQQFVQSPPVSLRLTLTAIDTIIVHEFVNFLLVAKFHSEQPSSHQFCFEG